MFFPREDEVNKQAMIRYFTQIYFSGGRCEKQDNEKNRKTIAQPKLFMCLKKNYEKGQNVWCLKLRGTFDDKFNTPNLV